MGGPEYCGVRSLHFRLENALVTEPFEQNESNVRYYCRRYPVVFSRGHGSTLITEDGKSYLDFLSGAGSLNYGHNNPQLRAALLKYITEEGVTLSLDMYSVAKRDFLSAFEQIILKKRNLNYKVQFTGPTGTNAVEAAMRLARKVTGRNGIAAFTNAFHGMSLDALSATGNSTLRGAARTPLPGVMRLPYDGYFGPEINTMQLIEKYLTDPSSGYDPPAAFLIETVQGEGGLNSISRAWFERLCLFARKIGSLVIVDDIQAGCGRTGSFFSFEPLGEKPDMICLSKSISGYGLPMSLVLIKPELDRWNPGEYNGTFRGNNHAFVTAAKALECYWQDGTFEPQLAAKGLVIRRSLEKIVAEVPGTQIRGRGMMQGLWFERPEQAERVYAQAFSRGLIVETCGPRDEVVKLLPALTIEEDELKQALTILRDATLAAVSKGYCVTEVQKDGSSSTSGQKENKHAALPT